MYLLSLLKSILCKIDKVRSSRIVIEGTEDQTLEGRSVRVVTRPVVDLVGPSKFGMQIVVVLVVVGKVRVLQSR
jgi:hypothetical protein